ncbi:TPA: hypothetical protein PJO77_003706 [Escherichia coli]|uniref:hypothetical protein n=1 Tax=Escherichia coli TaxID=562 RepID=UPI0011EE7940|nr:hypothetical protein [Escherichia coli]EEZ5978651.1 hypothetical protein [Escherichia coli O19]EEW1125207.1 hypothetical protein [Escherichia coli]EIB7502025.1 hypothetical protein [Escherichia coli]EKI2886045.1 hypothetical protein [Escherichia coli]ELA4031777.1 hypothetical protein [Escherichia coli]
MKMTHKKKFILDLFDCTKTDVESVGGWPLTADDVHFLIHESWIDNPYYDPNPELKQSRTNSIRQCLESLVKCGMLISMMIDAKESGYDRVRRKKITAYDLPFEQRKGRRHLDEKKYGVYGSICIGLYRMEEAELRSKAHTERVIEGEFETVVNDDSITLYEAERIYYSKQERHTADLCDIFGI